MRLFDGINHPSAQQVIAAGCQGALLYAGTPGDSLGKDFTGAQYQDYETAGLVCVFVFEHTANDMAGGHAGGWGNAGALLADLQAKGVDPACPVCSTVDEHVSAANIPLAVAYQAGFYQCVKANSWAAPTGVYGFAETLTACHDAGCADWYWGAGQRSLLPAFTNVWQDNTGSILVGGSVDDSDWILIPLPAPGGNMEWTDPLPLPGAPVGPGGSMAAQQILAELTRLIPGIAGEHPDGDVITWWRAEFAALSAQVAAVQGALSSDEAAILAAIGGVDSDVKAGFSPVTPAQLAALEAALEATVGPAVIAALGAAIVKGSA